MKIRKPGMAWVGKVLEISPIPDADRIQRAEVVCGKGGKWCGVVRKGDVEEGDVLAMSSSFSFVDLNNNHEWDTGEPTGAMPVISSHVLAGGRVILVSDPSIFINSMGTLDDNYGVIANIAGISSSRLFLDQSHLPYSDLHRTKDLLADVRGVLTTPAGTLALVAVLLIIILRPMWPRKGEGIGDIA